MVIDGTYDWQNSNLNHTRRQTFLLKYEKLIMTFYRPTIDYINSFIPPYNQLSMDRRNPEIREILVVEKAI